MRDYGIAGPDANTTLARGNAFALSKKMISNVDLTKNGRGRRRQLQRQTPTVLPPCAV